MVHCKINGFYKNQLIFFPGFNSVVNSESSDRTCMHSMLFYFLGQTVLQIFLLSDCEQIEFSETSISVQYPAEGHEQGT